MNLSQEIVDALVHQKGDLASVYKFLLAYEDADWQEISRQVIVMNQTTDAVYDAYITSVQWYKDLFFS